MVHSATLIHNWAAPARIQDQTLITRPFKMTGGIRPPTTMKVKRKLETVLIRPICRTKGPAAGSACPELIPIR